MKKIRRASFESSLMDDLVNEFVTRYKCHTVILYGSQARGDANSISDIDLMGVRKNGRRLRIAQKRGKKFLDAFIYPEGDLRKIGEHLLYMIDGIVLFEKNHFGSNFLRRLQKFSKKPPRQLALDETAHLRIWPFKMLERIEVDDVEAHYRRSWLQEALLSDYFTLRGKRYLGSKQSFEWIKKNDTRTFRLFKKVLASPTDLKLLRKLVERVTERKAP